MGHFTFEFWLTLSSVWRQSVARGLRSFLTCDLQFVSDAFLLLLGVKLLLEPTFGPRKIETLLCQSELWIKGGESVSHLLRLCIMSALDSC